ncbi:hypothetical protein ACO34A_00380 [Rhizobium sp. ACO-34A]|nr:AraC family transcriptional regulator [Rhizobium sp. ACO-34A]ATN32271.1 hypothetical protein ACO34A_00380 [Rhizobium sp. ACO-34A]
MTNIHRQSRAVSYIRVSALTPLIERLQKRRPIAGLLLSRQGIAADELNDPYAIVPLHRFVAFLEEASAALGEPSLGAKFGAEIKPADIGPMGMLFSLAPTIRDGFDRISRYVNSLQNATISGLVEEGESLVWSYHIADKTIWPRRQDAEYSVVASCELVRSCFNSRWKPAEVHFEHDMPENPDQLAMIIRAPVRFSQSSNRIIMDRSGAERIYRTEDKQLAMMLERHVADLMAQANGDISLVAQVTTLIDLYIGRRPITVSFLADELGMSPRTLQRRFEKEGLRVKDLTQAYRQQLATTLLSTRTAKMADIAQALGYADGAAFCRAFKNWSGHAPRNINSVKS